MIFKAKAKWPWRYRSRSKVITCYTPSHVSDHLYQIWKESIKNCRCYIADTIFKAKAKWPWRYRSRSKVIICTHPLILVIICAKYGKNPSRTVEFFFSRSRSNFQISKKNLHVTHPVMIVFICGTYKKNPYRTVDATERTLFSMSRPNDLEDIGQGQRSSHATHPLMLLIICNKYGKNPCWTVDATGRTRKVNRQTDRRTDRRRGWIQYTPPPNFVAGGIKMS